MLPLELNHCIIHLKHIILYINHTSTEKEAICNISLQISTYRWNLQSIWMIGNTNFEPQLIDMFFILNSIIPFSSVAQSSLTLCDLMDCSTQVFPVHHQLLELAHSCPSSQWCYLFHPLLSPSPPAPNLSQHQGLFQWVSSSHQVAKVLEFQLQHQSFQWIFRTDFL